MIEYVQADITTAPHTFIAHGCNARGKMGSGVAKALRNKWPEIYQPYIDHLKNTPNPMGTFVPVWVGGKCIANCITQEFYGYDGKRYADPIAIHLSLEGFIRYIGPDQHFFGASIAISEIGCTLGGLSWEDDVEPVITSLCHQFQNISFTVFKI
ncbi:Appr-1-p processing enzyme family protein [Rhizobium phage RHph_I1_18]|nr:Appr-1-p processing enzyme family protein [Rhizobium phage RHph_I1_18]